MAYGKKHCEIEQAPSQKGGKIEKKGNLGFKTKKTKVTKGA